MPVAVPTPELSVRRLVAAGEGLAGAAAGASLPDRLNARTSGGMKNQISLMTGWEVSPPSKSELACGRGRYRVALSGESNTLKDAVSSSSIPRH